ncbi:hypothetical protein BHM03_00062599 [Ensete ventricosum]|nr:hypothetical protein BHM03_00062599 [Ensete ventricosum]
MRWDLAGSSLGDLSKESGSSLGTRRVIAGKKTGGLTVRLLDYVGRRLDSPYHRIRETGSSFRWVNHPTIESGRWSAADVG